MKDFFISYAHEDESWAEWIAWELDRVGYKILMQKWDFNPGSNFVSEMHEAVKNCRKLLWNQRVRLECHLLKLFGVSIFNNLDAGLMPWFRE